MEAATVTQLQLRRYKRIRQRAYRAGTRGGRAWGCAYGQRWQEIVKNFSLDKQK